MSESGEQKLRAYLERATSALKQTKQKLQQLEAKQREPIAIVAMACRLPGGVETPEQLWQLLDEGRDAIAPFPTDRGWPLDGLYDPDPDKPGTTYTRGGGFIRHPGLFDAGFFGISPREAAAIDPQQRLLLELSWEVVERAGIVPSSLYHSNTGVFVGVCYDDYLSLAPPPELAEDGYATLGNLYSVSSGRIAYTLGLEGPAVSVDTACSTSLVTLHLACQSLRKGECDLALSGGATTFSTPEPLLSFSRLKTLSPDGRCKSFSAEADGAGWAEGGGMLLLERLSDAQRNGHPILGVVRGSAINQDGRSQGLTAPNGPSQRRVIQAALSDAGLDAGDIDAVEAHGTGTKLGDPIEAHALLATYGRSRDRQHPLLLGSIKSNIGHTQAAAGVAGIMKLVLGMQHGRLPKSLHAERPSPHIDWDEGTVQLLQEARPWPRGERLRRAAVSSFGISGTNAHVIIEEAPAVEAPAAEPAVSAELSPVVLPISGRTPAVLRAQAAALAVFLGELESASLADLGHALATSRTHFEHRAVVVAETREGARASLEAFAGDSGPAEVVEGAARGDARLAVLFTGQGSQRVGMGRELHRRFPRFRESFDEICACFDPHLDRSLAEVVFAEPGSELAPLLDQTRYTQPALFAVEVALFRLYESWGVRPALLLGHSIGELVAAHVAGVLSLEHACKLVEARARLMQALPEGGAMISIQASEDEVRELLDADGRVGIAGLNGPLSTVISGDEEPALAVAAAFEARGRKTRRLSVSHAFHSPRMEPMLAEFCELAASLDFHRPAIPVVSNVTGELATDSELASPKYWARHVREAVRFLDGVRTLERSGISAMLELGPHGILCGMASGCLSDEHRDELALISSLRRDHGEVDMVTAALGRLHCVGVTLDWSAIYGRDRAPHLPLPTYPFAHSLAWVEAGGRGARELGAAGLLDAEHPMLGALVALADFESVVFTGQLSLARLPWLAEHRVFGRAILPGTAFVELASVAAARLGLAEVAELTLEAPLAIPEHTAVNLQLRVEGPDAEGRRPLTIHSRLAEPEAGWVRHASGALTPEPTAAAPVAMRWPPPEAEAIELDDAYARLDARGLGYGPHFSGLRAAWVRGAEYFVEVRLPVPEGAQNYRLHPALLDAALHVLALVDDDEERVGLPFAWAGVGVHADGATALRVHLRPSEAGEGYRLDVRDTAGVQVASVERLSLRSTTAAELRSVARPRGDALYRLTWRPLALDPVPATASWVRLGAAELGLGLRSLAGLDELRAELEGGGEAPACVLVPLLGPAEGPLAETVAVLELLRAWLGEPRLASTRLAFVTRGAVAVDGGVDDLARAPVWGLLRTAQAEHPERELAIVDIDEAASSLAALPAAIAGGEPQLALRRGAASVPRLAQAGPGVDAQIDLAEGAVLITGGTGALGSLLARHLVEVHGVGELILSSRRGPAAPGADELRAALEASGAKVWIVACDLGDREAVAELLRSPPSEQPIRAIIHTAGVVDDSLIDSLTRERVARVFEPKVDAATHLHELSAELELSAFVLFASIAGLVGNAGQGSYAAANAYLDALAAARRSAGLPGLSLAWGPWAEAGMAAQMSEAARARLRRQGLVAIEPDEGLALFDAALRHPEVSSLAPTRFDLAALGQRDVLPPALRSLVRAPARPAARAPLGLAAELAAIPTDEREHAMVEIVRGEASTILGHAEGIPLARPLQELGLDSLMAVELRNRLQKRSGLRLPATLLFDYPTVETLAGMLLRELSVELEQPASAGAETASREARAGDEDDPVVIVAMACRYPGGVDTPEQLWRLLDEGRDAMSEFPTDRGWKLDELFDPDPDHPGTSVAREGGFLLDAAEFDAGFFGVSPREALAIDPQQRLLLETSWEALERGGVPVETLRGTPTGVFVGIMYSDYGSRLYASPEALEGYVAIGSAPSVASGRIAYTLGLEGPALTVDTACSSSLVAVHLAAQALRNHECDLALAGGATILATPTVFIEFSRQRGLAADGRCKAYSDLADGVGWSEGAGMLVLERMSDARAKGHPILAVLRGSAINQDGRSQGLTAPNGPSQQRVIKAALRDAGLGPAEIDAVEGHGTGTRLGDPIEVGALQAVYGRERGGEPLWLGSVKSNIGHTQAAAGVAGIIKVILAMQHETLPRSLHAAQPSSNIEWQEGVQLLADSRPWPADAHPRRAAVSSFGISGTNAHLIFEQAPPPAAESAREPSAATPVVPLLISARSAAALPAQARRLREFLVEEQPRLVDVAYSLATARSHLEHRAGFVAAASEELAAELDALDGPRVITAAAVDEGRLAMLFTGQGSQRPGMGRELCEVYPVFRAAFDEICARFDALLDRPLRELMFAAEGSEQAALLDQTLYTQPALFTLEVALYRLLASWGVRPDLLLGHSIGEIAAAHVAGVFELDDACKLVAARARLMQALPEGGAMISIQASEDELRERLAEHPGVDIAGINGPMSTVVSGDEAPAEALAARFEALGRKTRRLSVSHAFHSRRMEPMLEEFRALAATLEFRPARIPVVSNLSGALATDEQLGSPDYWVEHVREAVRFLDGVHVLEQQRARVLLELGPHGVLCSMAAACLSEAGQAQIGLLPALRRSDSEVETLNLALAGLDAHGVRVDWEAYFEPHAPARVQLPTYAFSRERYWLEAPTSAGVRLDSAGVEDAEHPLLGAAVALADSDAYLFTTRLSLTDQPWLGDHVVFDHVLVPGAVLLELALAVAHAVGAGAVEELTLDAPLALARDRALALQLSVSEPDASGRRALSVHSRPADGGVEAAWTLNAAGTLVDEAPVLDFELEPWPPVDARELALDQAYAKLDAAGLHYGPEFRLLRRVWSRGDERFVEVRLEPGRGDELDGYSIYPALLDAALHAIALEEDGVALPIAWTDASVRAAAGTGLRVRISPAGEGRRLLEIADERGQALASVGLATRKTEVAQLREALARAAVESLYRVEWRPVAASSSGSSSPPRAVVIDGGELLARQLGAEVVASPSELGDEPPERIYLACIEGEGGGLERSVALLGRLQALLGGAGLTGTQIVVLTRRAVATAEGEDVLDLAHSAAWGLVRAAQAEYPDRAVAIVDLDAGFDGSRLQLLEDALAEGEAQLAVRGDELLAPRLEAVHVEPRAVALPSEGTVLITGATGALGRLLARHLVEAHGVRHLLLCSRRGPEAPGADELREELEAAGAEVTLAACDISDRAQLQQLLEGIPTGHPLAAVFHTAGVLDDGLLSTLDRDRFARVFAPKLEAATHLHELTRERELAAFVLFSSIAGTIGNAGQANYAAANSYLDALCAHRKAHGLPGQSLAWGPWAEVGMAARLSANERAALRRQGTPPLTVEQGLLLLDASLGLDFAALAPVRLDTRALAAQPARSSMFRALVRASLHRAAEAEGPSSGLAAELAELSASERARRLLEFVRREAAAVLGLASPEQLEVDQPLQNLGLDSLMAVELRNRLQQASGLRLGATLLFDYPTIEALVAKLDEDLAGIAAPRPRKARRRRALRDEAVAIVGIGCRFPGGVKSPEDLWRVLETGGDAMSEFPRDRGWPLDLYDPDPEHPGTSVTREGGFLYDAADFDPRPFGISPREAMTIDPQQRLLLETGWEALERAGIAPTKLRGSATGVFVGIMYNDYGARLAQDRDALEGYLGIGSSPSVASGRLSYVFGFEGPAVTVDTACSSSLVALHLAAQALRNGECDLALAGGATVMATPNVFIEFSRQRGLAPDGRCKSFSAAADGVAWSEGAAVLVVERLSDARAKGHPILAVLRGSALNQDGRSQGLTAPNGPAQQRVIRAALDAAGLDGADVDLLEAHGTGTRLGDPIEAEALRETYGRERPKQQPLWLGSVKSNIGHTQAAAGAAGIIKVILAFAHERVPATIHLDEPSPHVEWENSGLELVRESKPWPAEGRSRRAAVSSFGISGTNAHVILEEPPRPAAPAERSQGAEPVCVLMSSHARDALAARTRDLARWLEAHPELELAELGYSLATTRAHLAERVAWVAESREQLLHLLAEPESEVARARAPGGAKLALLFTGQGAQRLGMGRELREVEPVFRAAFDDICARFDAHLDAPLAEVVFAAEGDARIDRTVYTQPALFALEVALYRLFASWGLKPDMLLGHSIGELAAAHVAGVFDLDDACKLVAARARLMQALPEGGAMVAVQASEAEVRELLERHPGVDIAGVNAATSTVISGDEQPTLALAAELEGRGRKVRQLRVSHAFHSHRMEPMLDEFRAVVASIEFGAPTLPIVSNLSGELASAEELSSPDYWARHLRQAVRFQAGVETLVGEGVSVCLELGPHAVLASMAAESGPELGLVPSLRRDRGEPEALAGAIAELYCHGVELDWDAYFARLSPRRVELPTSAFVRSRYWLDASVAREPAAATTELDAFWSAVAAGEAGALARVLGLGADDRGALDALLPSLRSWWAQRGDEDEIASWRYEVAWTPAAVEHPSIAGRYLLVRPRGVESPVSGEAPEGVELLELELGAARAGREQVAATLRGLELGELAGVISLLGFAEGAAAGQPALPLSLALNLALAQALGDLELDVPLWLLTRAAVSTGASDPVEAPEQALSWGFGFALAVEQPQRWGGLLDLPGPVALAQVLATIRRDDAEDQLALRGDRVFARRLVRARPVQQQRYEPRGTVLVTGGTGALGAHTARWLARRGAEHLVLTSRRGDSAPGARELRGELEELGVRVSIVACDVADREQLAATLARLEAEGDRLRAVFHVAGTLDDGLLPALDPARFARVLGPKLKGTLALHELTESLELDAFVLFSSFAGVVGNPGQTNYAAANAFLDAFAAYRRGRGLPASSIAWGPWAGEGMAVGVDQQLEAWGLAAMSPGPATAALADAVNSAAASLTIVDVDWSKFSASLRGRRLLAALPEAALEPEPEPGPALRERLAELLPEQRAELVLDEVIAQTAAILRIEDPDELDPDTGFADLGLDSLMAVELRQRIQRLSGLKLPATLTYDFPSPRRLAAELGERLGRELAPAEEGETKPGAGEPDELEFDTGALEGLSDDELAAAALALLGEGKE